MSRTVKKKIKRLCARSAVWAVSVTQRPSQSLGCVSTFSIKGRENPRLNLLFDPNTQMCTATLWAHCHGLSGHRAICVLQEAHARRSTITAPWKRSRMTAFAQQELLNKMCTLRLRSCCPDLMVKNVRF